MSQRPPGLQIEGSAVHDFGTARHGETLRHAFSLVNSSQAPIEIVELRTSCSCVVPGGEGGFHETHVGPHARVKLPIALHTSGADATAGGRAIVFFRQQSRPPAFGQLELLVKAAIEPDYRLEPRSIDLGEVSGLDSLSVNRKIRVTPVALPSLVVRGATTSADWLKVAVAPIGDASQGYEVEVVLDAAHFNETKSFDTTLVVATDSQRAPKAAIAVTGKYIAPVEALPPIIIVGSDERGNVERKVRLRCCCLVQLRQAATSPSGASCRFDPERVAREHELTIVVPETTGELATGESATGETKLTAEFFPAGETSVTRELTIPIYRFGPSRRQPLAGVQ